MEILTSALKQKLSQLSEIDSTKKLQKRPTIAKESLNVNDHNEVVSHIVSSSNSYINTPLDIKVKQQHIQVYNNNKTHNKHTTKETNLTLIEALEMAKNKKSIALVKCFNGNTWYFINDIKKEYLVEKLTYELPSDKHYTCITYVL